jgi:hypothetical protein
MENQPPATANDLITALNPTRISWRHICRRSAGWEDVASELVSTPLFLHTYVHMTQVIDLPTMTLDVKSGTGLIANNIFTIEEIEEFTTRGLAYYLNAGMVLAARHLRTRQNTIPVETFVHVARTIAFSFILRLIGNDLTDPIPIFEMIVETLPIPDDQKMSLFHAAVANIALKPHAITLH